MTLRSKALALTVSALALTTVLVGCGNKQETTGGTTSSSSAGSGAKQYKVAGIVFQEDQFFRLVEGGMKSAAEKNNVDLMLENSNNLADKEVSLIDTYIGKKVDAIVISPVNPKSSVAALKRASEAGIKVITYNSKIDDTFPVSSITSDEADLGRQTGKAAAEFIKSKLGGKATVAIVCFKSLIPEQSGARVGGFKSEMAKLPGVKIVAEQDAWMAEKAQDVVTTILTGNPNVNIVWAANEGGTVGAVMAVNAGNKAGKVFVFGTDMSNQMGDLLTASDGVLQAVTGQKPVEIGSMALEAAVKALKGESVEKSQTLPGVLYSRDNPAGIKEYVDSVKEYTGK